MPLQKFVKEHAMRTGVYKYRDGINFNFRVTSSPCGKVAVRVDKSGNLCVTGPRHVELRFVTELIDKHYEELRRDPRFSEFNPYNDVYSDKGKYLILGKLYSIKLCPADVHDIEYRIDDESKVIRFLMPEFWFDNYFAKYGASGEGSLILHEDEVSRLNLSKNIKVLLEYLLLGQIKKIVAKYCPKLNLEFPKVQIKKYKGRYGCCYYKRNLIIFDLGLVYFEHECIEACVVHELAHFIFPDHSPNFYKLVRSLYPDYDYADQKLDQSVGYLVNLNRKLHLEQQL